MINKNCTVYKGTSQRGAAMLIFVIFFLFSSLSLTFILANNILSDQKTARILVHSKQSYLTSLSANEDMLYRYVHGLTPDSTESITLGGAFATSTVSVAGDNYTITSESDYFQAQRASEMTLAVTSGIAFNFGMQSGTGGILLENSASVEGNLYSNGPIVGQNSAIVKGDAVSAGPSGSFDGLRATGTVRANNIISSPSIGKDAYYQTINLGATTVLGTKYPGSANQATSSFPIDDATIAGWEADALAGGTYAGPCPYIINTSISLGPKKILCDVEVDKVGMTLTLTGPIWIQGTLTVKKGTVRVGPSLAGKIIPIIAHKASAPGTSGTISIENGASFTSATGDSYTMLISMNNSGETGGSTNAIRIQNSSAGELLLYAPHGILALENNTSIRQATAWRIHGKNSSVVKYKTGLLNPDFLSGPTGTFTIQDWDETY